MLISAFGVLATVLAGLGLYLTYKTGQEQQQLNTERLVTDRFAKAVEQLGNGTIDVRIGAIYSLERIAKDSPKDHWTITEVLCAFVRNRSKLLKDEKQEPQLVTTDVQSALTVIGRRKRKNDPLGQQLDLAFTNLIGADLSFANLEGANLWSANLRNAGLTEANLSGADLRHANLSLTDLNGADLYNADLYNADLRSVTMEKGVVLIGAVNTTTDQVKTAKNWQFAHYDPNFRQQLGLPPEQP